MMKHCLGFLGLIIVAALFLGEDASAGSDDWYLSAANYARYYYFKDTKQDSAATRFQYDIYYGKFYQGAWYEAKHVSNQGSFNFTLNDITQRYIGWEDRGLTIQAGNFYQVFDRGLALNSFRDDNVSVDLVLDGFKVNLRNELVDVDAFSATPGYGNSAFDPIIRGVRTKLKPIPQFQVGGAYVSYTLGTRTNVDQINGRLLLDYVDAYIEYARKRYVLEDIFNPANNQNKQGDGTYASLTGYAKGFTYLLEYKNYYELFYPEANYLNIPPAVNHSDRLLETEASNIFIPINGEVGYRANGTFSWTDYWGVELGYSHTKSRDTTAMNFNELFSEIRGNYLGDNVFKLNIDWIKFNWELSDSVSNIEFFRNELRPEFEAEYFLDDFKSLVLDGFLIHYDYPDPGTADSTYYLADSTDYTEKNISLTYAQAPHFTITIGGSFSNKKHSEDAANMGYIEAILSFDNHDLTLFYGSQRGGLVCSGGVCVYHSTFEGFRAILLSRF